MFFFSLSEFISSRLSTFPHHRKNLYNSLVLQLVIFFYQHLQMGPLHVATNCPGSNLSDQGPHLYNLLVLYIWHNLPVHHT